MLTERKNYEPIILFLSYAPEDEPLRAQLEKHLALLQRQGLISAWHDRQLLAGSDWVQKTNEQLNMASIILLLISSDFLASNYFYSVEMQQALERAERNEAYVIPVLLRPVNLQGASFQDLPSLPQNNKPVTIWSNPDEAFQEITAGIRAAAEQIHNAVDRKHLPPLSIPASPVTPDQSHHEVGIQSNAGGNITIEGSTVQIAARDIYNVPLSRTQRELIARERLLECIERQWIKGVYKKSLYQQIVLTLQLEEDPDAIFNPWLLEVQEVRSTHLSFPSTEIIQIYDDSLGSLLILGEPGSGKTTLLLTLLQELLRRVRQDSSEAIPILFTLVSWSRQKLALVDWLIEELEKKYSVSRATSKQLIESGSCIPLLDGLDEVAQGDRAACVQAINTYREQYDIAPVVICCRKADYYTLINKVEKLKLTQAIVIQPLTSQQISNYLNARSEELAALCQVYQQNPVLQELARTPLMLNILTLAYHRKRRAEILLEGSLEDLQRQIFAAYVRRMFERRKATSRYSTTQTISWLSWLARQLRHFNMTEFDIIYMNTDWLPQDLQFVYRMIWSLIDTSWWFLPYLPFLLLILIISFIDPHAPRYITLFLIIFFSFAFLVSFLYFFDAVHPRQRENARQDQKSKEKRAERIRYIQHYRRTSPIYPAESSMMNQLDIMEHSIDTNTFIISRLLRSRGLIPPHYQQFLDYATERIFLQRVGNRYMFIHRLLLDYFADLENEDDTQRQKE